jgi:hypothetical protein
MRDGPAHIAPITPIEGRRTDVHDQVPQTTSSETAGIRLCGASAHSPCDAPQRPEAAKIIVSVEEQASTLIVEVSRACLNLGRSVRAGRGVLLARQPRARGPLGRPWRVRRDVRVGIHGRAWERHTVAGENASEVGAAAAPASWTEPR